MQDKTKYVNILDTDKIGSLLFKLSMPVFMGMFVQTLYNVISTIFIGQYVGPLGIAGLSIAFPLQMMGVALGNLAGIGGMSLISRSLGAGDNEKAEKALGNGIVLALVLGVVVLIALLPFLDFWLTLIGASDAVLPYARDYMTFVAIGMIFQIMVMALLNFARAEGNARVGMTAMIMGALINIALSFVFIVWMDMGIRGAGLAILLAQIASVVYIATYYISSSSYLKVRRRNYRPDFKIIKQILAIGVGAFMQLFAGSLSAMILIKMVVTYGGDYALGAFGITQRVLMFANMPAMVLAQGAQPILGFNYGARRFKHVLKSINLAIVYSLGLSMAGFLVVYFIPEPIIRIFSDDPQLVSIGAGASRRIFLALPLIGPMMVGTMIFQAIGKAKQAFIAAIARPVLFLVPAVFILSSLMGLDGVWLSFPASDLLTFLLVLALMLPVLKYFRKEAALESLDNTAMLSGSSLSPNECSASK